MIIFSKEFQSVDKKKGHLRERDRERGGNAHY